MSLDRLIEVGAERVREHAAFGKLTTYRVGGSVRALVTLSSDDDIRELGPLLAACGLPLFALGNGSNVLVADGEHEIVGVVVGGDFEEMTWSDDGDVVRVVAGAGLDLPIASRRLAKAGIVGFEWAVGVPGTFGGAVVMNAGGHGSEMKASVEAVEVWRNGVARTRSREELQFGYRTSAIEQDDIVSRVHLSLVPGDADEAQARIRDIVHWRREHQPGGANAGSAFRNPEDDHAGRLIEEAGCKGQRLGSAVVSEKHSNFIIADPDGRANDVFELLWLVRARVFEVSGVTLTSEHRFLGFEGVG